MILDSRVFLLLILGLLLGIKVFASKQKVSNRLVPVINACNASRLIFGDNIESNIVINGHCVDPLARYAVSGSPINELNGLYEERGVSDGAPKFEHVLRNGTVLKIYRAKTTNMRIWIIGSTSDVFYINAASGDLKPPKNGWLIGSSPFKAMTGLSVISKIFPNINQMTSLNVDSLEMLEGIELDGSVIEATSDPADSLLNNKVNRELGLALSKVYKSSEPVDAISIDGLLKYDILSKALSFKNIPLSNWEGPENGQFCCFEKYRLDFEPWNNTYFAMQLQSLIGNKRFISFLEGLTGIDGLIPMTVSDRRIIQLGSSLIAIRKGGYLVVHNDFNRHEGLHRRLNVLLYLNEDWQNLWQGHLELWDSTASRCVQRISPVFNRMGIFTVTDDAFHGHPEPIDGPEDAVRYAFQLVYYTKEKGPKNSDHKGRKLEYKDIHSAIFQPTCVEGDPLNRICNEQRRPAMEPDYDTRLCECHYR